MKHKKVFRLELSTNDPNMSKEEFDELIAHIVFNFELSTNENGLVRCHIHDNDN